MVIVLTVSFIALLFVMVSMQQLLEIQREERLSFNNVARVITIVISAYVVAESTVAIKQLRLRSGELTDMSNMVHMLLLIIATTFNGFSILTLKRALKGRNWKEAIPAGVVVLALNLACFLLVIANR